MSAMPQLEGPPRGHFVDRDLAAEAIAMALPLLEAAMRHPEYGDSGFLHYNAFWVLVAVLMVLAGAVVLLRGRGFLDALMATPRRAVITLFLLGGLGWAYALAERATIAPPT